MSDDHSLGSPFTPSSGALNGNGNGKLNGHGNGSGNGNGGTAYADPDADVELKSTDGRVFKVHSYFLKAHSAYFRKLLDSGIPSDPIPINATTKVLKLYLDLMHYKSIPPSWVWQHKDALLKLSDELGSPGPAERALFVLHDRVDKDPWAMFCLASQKGSVSLAKSALKALADANPEGHYQMDITSLTPVQVAHVSLPYLLGLFNAALVVQGEHRHGHTHDHAHQHEISWKVIADKFSPVVG